MEDIGSQTPSGAKMDCIGVRSGGGREVGDVESNGTGVDRG